MLHEYKGDTEVEVGEGGIGFDDIKDKEYFPQEYANEIEKSNCLLVPYEAFGQQKGPLFPEDTQEFFLYIKDNDNSGKIIPEVCVSDSEYKELVLHADVINLPTLIVEVGVLPIVVNLISCYLYDKIKSRKSNLDINVSINVVEGKKKIEVKYKGDSEKFKEVMESISQNIEG